MVSEKLVVKNPSGIHARPASRFVSAANKFESKLTIIKDGKAINGKSILGVLGAAITCGSEVEFILEGSDEQEALQALVALVDSGLGESFNGE